MDIASLSMTLSQNKIMTNVSVALLSKSLDMAENLSGDVSDMIEAMPAPSLSPDGVGANIDISV
jgi:hypothetical protein